MCSCADRAIEACEGSAAWKQGDAPVRDPNPDLLIQTLRSVLHTPSRLQKNKFVSVDVVVITCQHAGQQPMQQQKLLQRFAST